MFIFQLKYTIKAFKLFYTFYNKYSFESMFSSNMTIKMT